MNELLPITIKVNDELVGLLAKIKSITNKLEAQFNFQTMTANWYGDEDNILFITLSLSSPSSFTEQQEALPSKDINHFSDDVFCYYQGQDEQQMVCHIALTDSELTMLAEQEKLLSPLLQVKLQKVLNLIANKLKLTAI